MSCSRCWTDTRSWCEGPPSSRMALRMKSSLNPPREFVRTTSAVRDGDLLLRMVDSRVGGVPSRCPHGLRRAGCLEAARSVG
eukprot:763908-Hanusia_phi.AAC.7